LILNELINENSVTASKNDIKCDDGSAKKIRWWHDWSVDDFDSMKIRLPKFDSAGV